MPGYLFHLAFGEEVLKKGGIIDKELFKLGSISPDLAPNKQLSHFKNKTIGPFVVPNLDDFTQKYTQELTTSDFVKGYFSHLYLDYYFISEFVANYIVTLDKKMQPTDIPTHIKFIKLLKNNKYIDLENPAEAIEIDSFFRERILHREYSALNTHFRNDFALTLPQFTDVPNSISELPPSSVTANFPTLSKELSDILLSSDQSASIFFYEDYKAFSKELANKFNEVLKRMS